MQGTKRTLQEAMGGDPVATRESASATGPTVQTFTYQSASGPREIPTPMAFVLEKETETDDIVFGVCTTVAVIPVVCNDANAALDTAFKLTKTRKDGSSIVAVFDPVIVDGEISSLKTSELWHWAPPLLIKERQIKIERAEASIKEGKYAAKFQCRGCKDSYQSHSFYGEEEKGGCHFPLDVFQAYDDPDCTVLDREGKTGAE